MRSSRTNRHQLKQVRENLADQTPVLLGVDDGDSKFGAD